MPERIKSKLPLRMLFCHSRFTSPTQFSTMIDCRAVGFYKPEFLNIMMIVINK